LAGTIAAPVLPPIAVCGCQSQFHLSDAVTHIHDIVGYVHVFVVYVHVFYVYVHDIFGYVHVFVVYVHVFVVYVHDIVGYVHGADTWGKGAKSRRLPLAAMCVHDVDSVWTVRVCLMNPFRSGRCVPAGIGRTHTFIFLFFVTTGDCSATGSSSMEATDRHWQQQHVPISLRRLHQAIRMTMQLVFSHKAGGNAPHQAQVTSCNCSSCNAFRKVTKPCVLRTRMRQETKSRVWQCSVCVHTLLITSADIPAVSYAHQRPWLLGSSRWRLPQGCCRCSSSSTGCLHTQAALSPPLPQLVHTHVGCATAAVTASGTHSEDLCTHNSHCHFL